MKNSISKFFANKLLHWQSNLVIKDFLLENAATMPNCITVYSDYQIAKNFPQQDNMNEKKNKKEWGKMKNQVSKLFC